MNEELIRSIATEMVNQSIIGNYKTYLLIVCISLIVGSVTAFTSSYLKKRGKQYATKADFEKILDQIKQTTKVTEEIKVEISEKSQDNNNLKILVREKLELVISETFELELWLERARSKALSGQLVDANDSPIAKIEMYQAIYFKKVESELLSLQKTSIKMWKFILDLAGQKIKNKNLSANIDIDKYTELQVSLNKSLIVLRKRLLLNIQKILACSM